MPRSSTTEQQQSQLRGDAAGEGRVDPGVGARVQTGQQHQQGERGAWTHTHTHICVINLDIDEPVRPHRDTGNVRSCVWEVLTHAPFWGGTGSQAAQS